ncbi:MAG: hypothetical protein ABH952_10205 [Candidatus Omnitrophota bacterium]
MIYVDQLIERILKLAVKHKKKLYVLGFIILSYLLILIVVSILGKTVSEPPDKPESYNQLDISNYIKSFRKSGKDYNIARIYFTTQYLSITLNLLYIPKTEREYKTLAVDIVLGLSQEYPQLNKIKVKLQRYTAKGKIFNYGRCEYEKETKNIKWISGL